MSDFIFDHYFPIAQGTIAAGFAVLVVGMLITTRTSRLKRGALAACIYVALVGLGMSEDIKHLSPLGLLHAATALAIAGVAVGHFKQRIALLLYVPCVLMGIVILFNLVQQGRGLELMGRWTG